MSLGRDLCSSVSAENYTVVQIQALTHDTDLLWRALRSNDEKYCKKVLDIIISIQETGILWLGWIQRDLLVLMKANILGKKIALTAILMWADQGRGRPHLSATISQQVALQPCLASLNQFHTCSLTFHHFHNIVFWSISHHKNWIAAKTSSW